MLQARRPGGGRYQRVECRERGGCRAFPTSGPPGEWDCSTRRMISSFSPDAGYANFLAVPIRDPGFFFAPGNRNSRACSATTSFSPRASCRRSLTSLLVAARAVSPASLRLPASGTPSTSCNTGSWRNAPHDAQLRDAVLTPRPSSTIRIFSSAGREILLAGRSPGFFLHNPLTDDGLWFTDFCLISTRP